LLGHPIERDTSGLTKRLSGAFRQQNSTTCFYIDQSDKLALRLAQLRQDKPAGRTAKALKRNRKWLADTIADFETRLRLAKEYEAETLRIREASGVDAAKQRVSVAEKSLDAAAVAVSTVPSRTLVGLRLKADTLLATLERWRIPRNDVFLFGAVWRLTEETLDATQDLDGKRKGAPLPATKGGAA